MPTNCPLCGKTLKIDKCEKINSKKHKRENIIWCESGWKDFAYHYAYFYNLDGDRPFSDEIIYTGDYILSRYFMHQRSFSRIEKYRRTKTTKSTVTLFEIYDLIEILTRPEDFENFLILL